MPYFWVYIITTVLLSTVLTYKLLLYNPTFLLIFYCINMLKLRYLSSIFDIFHIILQWRNKRSSKCKNTVHPLQKKHIFHERNGVYFVGFSTSYVRDINVHFYSYVSPRSNTCRLNILLNNLNTFSSRVFVPPLYI